MMTYEYMDLEIQISKDDLLLVVADALGPLTGLGKLIRIDPNFITIGSLTVEEEKWINAQLENFELDDTVLTSVLWPVIIPIHTIKLISVIRHEHEMTQQEEITNNDRDTERDANDSST